MNKNVPKTEGEHPYKRTTINKNVPKTVGAHIFTEYDPQNFKNISRNLTRIYRKLGTIGDQNKITQDRISIVENAIKALDGNVNIYEKRMSIIDDDIKTLRKTHNKKGMAYGELEIEEFEISNSGGWIERIKSFFSFFSLSNLISCIATEEDKDIIDIDSLP